MPDGGELIRQSLRVLAAQCDAHERPFEQIEKTVSTRFSPGETPDDMIERARTLAALGMDHVVVLTRGPWTTDHVAALARAVPYIADL